jgi:4-diphosphocytidyl-2-C-methyl-D-erythritol kinase
MAERLMARAPAKVNLVLEVTGRRGDGYHEVDTILQTLELADLVTLEPAGGDRLEICGPWAGGTPSDESNLALAALYELRRAGAVVPPVRVRIEKHIPAAAGLGGGASDAAAVLRLAQRAFPTVADEQVRAAAERVGSDEAFFLVGGTARARGRGELVRALPALPEHGVVLFVPAVSIERKTARMFAALDAHPFDDGAVVESLARRLPAGFTGEDIYNAFERVAFDVFPWLASLQAELEARIGEAIRLAGAGPTLFWIGRLEDAGAVARRARGLSATIIETRTAGSTWSQ